MFRISKMDDESSHKSLHNDVPYMSILKLISLLVKSVSIGLGIGTGGTGAVFTNTGPKFSVLHSTNHSYIMKAWCSVGCHLPGGIGQLVL